MDVVFCIMIVYLEVNVVFFWEGNVVVGIMIVIKEKGVVGKVVVVVNDMILEVVVGLKDGMIYGISC